MATEDLTKFNPYHVDSGPGGGQFTSGDGIAVTPAEHGTWYRSGESETYRAGHGQVMGVADKQGMLARMHQGDRVKLTFVQHADLKGRVTEIGRDYIVVHNPNHSGAGQLVTGTSAPFDLQTVTIRHQHESGGGTPMRMSASEGTYKADIDTSIADITHDPRKPRVQKSGDNGALSSQHPWIDPEWFEVE